MKKGNKPYQDRSTNLSYQNREKLIDICERLKNENNDIQRIKDINEIISKLRKLEKYGLSFEEHTEPVKEMLKTHIPVFDKKENKKYEEIVCDKNKPYNFLLEGDNLHSLILLNRAKIKVDVIYIDPPYNTGNKDFIYADAIVDSDNAYRHSKWLSFMNERLLLAKELLADNGVIFISIDDNEQANLKLLCDEVFGENNFLACISVVNNLKGRSDDKFFATANEYLLVYAKNVYSAVIKGFEMDEEKESEYKYSDEISRYKLVSLKKTGKNCYREDRPNMYYPIYYYEKENRLKLENVDNSGIEILPQINGREGCWRWGKETFSQRKETEIICKKVNGEFSIYVKMRDEVNGEKRTIKPKILMIL